VSKPSVPASVPVSRVLLCVFLTWLVPGWGHWLLGRRGKAVLYFTLITFLFVFGMWLGDFRNVHLEQFPIHFLGQVFYGGATLPSLLLTRGLALEVPGAGVVLGFPNLDVGVVYTTVAGLLNVCVMVDVYEAACPRPQPAEVPA